MTHLPFRICRDRKSQSETTIFEFPVTIEDEESPPLDKRLDKALDFAEKISSYGGLYVILIHPNVLEGKFKFLKGFLEEWKDRAWFGTVQDFGDWWTARCNTRITSEIIGLQRSMTLQLQDTIKGLTLTVPASWRMVSVEPGTINVKQTVTTIVIEEAHDTLRINFHHESK